ncbi:MAG: hypothetical protein OWP43_09615 [Sphaerochaetaceae bacterium]|nr:hypothetical protein [Sphaerochaetaceae bacterium]
MGDWMVKKKQVKSKKRVVEHGEVFTAEREVKAMCDLVKSETERIESRFLEPACGDGNFLSEILNRKLDVVFNRYGKSIAEYERYSILAVSSLYGVDILEDNAKECRERLYNIWNERYIKLWKSQIDKRVQIAAKFIISKNILYGDALTMKKNDGEPIVFSEWSLVTGDKIKRRDYQLYELLDGQEGNMSLFWDYDEETSAYIPPAIKDYPIVNYREVING